MLVMPVDVAGDTAGPAWMLAMLLTLCERARGSR